MNLQSKLIVSLILAALVMVLIRNYRAKRILTGQILIWLAFLLGAEVLVLFPRLVDLLSVLWGNLIPVSWISFSGLAFLILYLLHHTFRLNDLRSHAVDLSRHVTFLEERLRRMEVPPREGAAGDRRAGSDPGAVEAAGAESVSAAVSSEVDPPDPGPADA